LAVLGAYVFLLVTIANVKMMIYTEDANVNTSGLITNLQNQFIPLSQQGKFLYHSI